MELNALQKWEIDQWVDRFKELEKAGIEIKEENIERIIEHMSFEARSKRNPGKCTLYPTGKSCHPEIKDLNCLLCPCPAYDNSTERGACKEKRNKGFYYHSIKDDHVQVWDCSNCKRYHSPEQVRNYLKKRFDNLRQLQCGTRMLEAAEQADKPA